MKNDFLGCKNKCGSQQGTGKLEARLSELEDKVANLATKDDVSDLNEKLENLRDEAVTEDELEVQKDFNGTPRTQTVKLKET